MERPRCNAHKGDNVRPLGCTTCERISVEQLIVRMTVRALLTAGYRLSVNNGGEDYEISDSASVAMVYKALMLTDEEYLIAENETHRAMVRFVYGNDGYDVICDYSVSLEGVLGPVLAYAEKLGEV